jgi:hypothetical protein
MLYGEDIAKLFKYTMGLYVIEHFFKDNNDIKQEKPDMYLVSQGIYLNYKNYLQVKHSRVQNGPLWN